MFINPIEPGAVEADQERVLGILDCERAIEQFGQDQPKPGLGDLVAKLAESQPLLNRDAHPPPRSWTQSWRVGTVLYQPVSQLKPLDRARRVRSGTPSSSVNSSECAMQGSVAPPRYILADLRNPSPLEPMIPGSVRAGRGTAIAHSAFERRSPQSLSQISLP